MIGLSTDTPVLINFADSRIVVELVHANYIAHVVEQDPTAWTAAAVRNLQFRLFSEREAAVDWLTLDEV